MVVEALLTVVEAILTVVEALLAVVEALLMVVEALLMVVGALLARSLAIMTVVLASPCRASRPPSGETVSRARARRKPQVSEANFRDNH